MIKQLESCTIHLGQPLCSIILLFSPKVCSKIFLNGVSEQRVNLLVMDLNVVCRYVIEMDDQLMIHFHVVEAPFTCRRKSRTRVIYGGTV